eukprot:365534-Chlamydomonas_euryale.AAC.5
MGRVTSPDGFSRTVRQPGSVSTLDSWADDRSQRPGAADRFAAGGRAGANCGFEAAGGAGNAARGKLAGPCSLQARPLPSPLQPRLPLLLLVLLALPWSPPQASASASPAGAFRHQTVPTRAAASPRALTGEQRVGIRALPARAPPGAGCCTAGCGRATGQRYAPCASTQALPHGPACRHIPWVSTQAHPLRSNVPEASWSYTPTRLLPRLFRAGF